MTRDFGQFRNVPHHRVWDYLERGWMIVDTFDDCHHGFHGVSMWRCDCFASEPPQAKEGE